MYLSQCGDQTLLAYSKTGRTMLLIMHFYLVDKVVCVADEVVFPRLFMIV